MPPMPAPLPMLASRLPDWLGMPARLLGAAANALLPSMCALCGEANGEAVCAACRAAYAAPLVPALRCPRCANPLASPARRRGPHDVPPAAEDKLGLRLRGGDEGNDGGGGSDDVCGACLRDAPAYDATVAAVEYAAPLDGLVLQLKFNARLPLASWCARMIRDAALAAPGLALPDLLCPVPLGERRLVERGYNQALEIARPLAGALGVALHPRLAVRVRETGAQSGTTPGARAENVQGAFALPDPAQVAGRHVGLVDDVMTSGHTLGELAAVCKRAGAARVTNFVFARTPP